MARCMPPGELDVLQLDDRDIDTPLLGLDIEDLTDVLVDRLGLGERLVEHAAVAERQRAIVSRSSVSASLRRPSNPRCGTSLSIEPSRTYMPAADVPTRADLRANRQVRRRAPSDRLGPHRGERGSPG